MTEATNTKSKAPVFIAYSVRDNGTDESFWTRIGAVWSHGKSKGFTLQLDAIPLDGKVVMIEPKAKE